MVVVQSRKLFPDKIHGALELLLYQNLVHFGCLVIAAVFGEALVSSQQELQRLMTSQSVHHVVDEDGAQSDAIVG